MALRKVDRSVLGGTLSGGDVRSKHAARTLTLASNDASHF
jgi:hypothetical protein